MDDVHPRMRFSLSPPSPKVIFSTNVTPAHRCGSEPPSAPQSQHHYQDNNNTINTYQYNNMQRQEDNSNSNSNANQTVESDTTSDYKQWLHAMKLVARLPGGIPPEFRRKLWLSLADKYLKSKNVDWDKEEEKCFCEKWREDDEELGIQIVKDLHRTGSTLCTGPAGDVNQAKLKRILLGYARYNPEVGYCQGFNMLGALILQVMDKEEAESIKVMIYLVEGILPTGYFCGSMGGLQADMAVFRELMQIKLPKLAKHLQKLQGPMENAYEPPLTNVFTMQWFLTMFCTCLPMSCVLRVWDLVLIEGSDVLLRTALALWSLLEERVLSTRSADDFYGKMGSFSSELLNGHLIDSNGLIEKVVQLGPISDIQKLRDKHLYNIAPLRNQQGLHLYYDEDEPDIDEDSRLAVATVWGIPWGRRGSQGQTTIIAPKQTTENKDRIALDISLLKKQYDRLRERQKQAHIILTTACSSARQGSISSATNVPLPVNQLLSGRPAIITNKGRRIGPPPGAIPPARKPSLPAVLQYKPLEKHLRRGETLHWRDTSNTMRRRDSLTWKEIKAERKALITSGSVDGLKSQKIRSRRLGKSDSSSYSEESDEDNEDGDGSTTDTSFCDEEYPPSAEVPKKSQKVSTKLEQKSKKKHMKQRNLSANIKENVERERPKSWAPSYSDIPFVLMTIDSPTKSADENPEREFSLNTYADTLKEEEKSLEEDNDEIPFKDSHGLSWKTTIHSPIGGDLALTKSDIHCNPTDSIEVMEKSDKSHASPFQNKNLALASKTHLTESTNSLGSGGGEEDEVKTFDVSDEGVTNEYFERVNTSDRPTKLDLLFSLNEEESIRDAYKYKTETEPTKLTMTHDDVLKNSRRMDLLVDYSEKSSAACIAEAKSEISTTLQTVDAHSIRKDLTDEIVLKRPLITAAEKRRNPRRLTLTRSSTMDIEKRYQALEKRLSMEISSVPKPFLGENEIFFKEKQQLPLNFIIKENQIKSDESKTTHKEHKDVQLNETIVPPLKDDQFETKRPIPSTADLEERLKKKEHLDSQHAEMKIPPLKDDHFETKRPIPSTADLEERFRKNEMILPQLKDDQSEIKRQIPSTADLEERFKKNEMILPQLKDDHFETKRQIPSSADLEDRFKKNEMILPQLKDDQSETKRKIQDLSSADLEDRFRKKELIDVQQAEMIEPPPKDDQFETKRQIPSTADLEERFKIMKLHLISERTDKIQSASDSESGGQQKNGQPRKMSTTEETRERNKNVNKNEQTGKAEELDVDTNETNEEKAKVTKEDSEPKPSTSKGNKESKKDNMETESNETKSINNKTNVLPSKKEPPDIKESEATVKESKPVVEADTQVTQPQNTDTKHEKVPSVNNRKTKTDDYELTGSGKSAVQLKNEELNEELAELENKHQETRDVIHKDSKTGEGKDTENKTSPAVQRKSPPSTEELEKRFSALEKQMSISISNETQNNLEADKPKKKTKEDEPEVENENSKESVENTPKTSTEKAEKDIEDESKSMNTQTMTSVAQKLVAESTKRRLSEPPSTEDLERRYEVVKRGMSYRQFNIKSVTEERTMVQIVMEAQNAKLLEDSVRKASPQTLKTNEQANVKHSPKESLEDCSEELPQKTDKDSNKPTTKQSPPTTENLEKRYADLQNNAQKKETSNTTSKEKSPNKPSPPSTKNLEERFNKLQDNSRKKSMTDLAIKENNETKVNSKQKAAIKSPALDNGSRQKRSALMEELQTKFKANASEGEQVKPSVINPTRRPTSKNNLLASLSFNDGTSETHATSAYSISGKYEPGSSSQRKMVRRFSDLPSRADLENRLQFLEERLSKTWSKQRRSSDSEVASKHHRSKRNIQPSNTPASGSLEYRVLELEKYLKESRTLSMDVECTQTNEKREQDSVSQIEVAGDNAVATGKELVRYSQYGEVSEFNHQNPINISINIQMTLPKDDHENKKQNDLPKAEDLDRRMLILEQQMKTPQSFNDSEKRKTTGSKSRDLSGDVIEHQADSTQENGSVCEPKVRKTTDSKSSDLSGDVIEHQADLSQENKSVCEPSVNGAMAIEKEEVIEKSIEIHETHDQTLKKIIQETKQKSEIESDAMDKTKSTDIADSSTAESTKSNNVEEFKKKMESINKSLTEPEITRNTTTKTKETKTANEFRQDPTKEIKTVDNNDNRNQDQSESNKQHDIETKSTEVPQTNDRQNLVKEVKESEVITKIPDSKVSKTSSCDEPKSHTTETKRQNDIQSKSQSNEVNEIETTNVIENKVIENTKEMDLEMLRHNENLATSLGSSQMVPIEVNKKTLVLLLDNEPKSVKVRRLTRANTKELEDLFQALEKQLTERSQDKADMESHPPIPANENLQKSKQTELESNENLQKSKQIETELTQAMADLTKEIHEFAKSEKAVTAEPVPKEKEKQTPKKPEVEDFDWGIDPNKYHLKKRTVYLPSTKELESRFRSLERQIKLLEDVEKIDVEQRLIEIERKIKLQYSLSHEKDLNKFLELCEGKLPDDVSPSWEKQPEQKDCSCHMSSDHRQYTTSPKHTSPKHISPKHMSPKHTSPKKYTADSHESHYRSPDHKHSMSKQVVQREPIHRLEMILAPSPDECSIPTTGELEHRMRVMDGRRSTPSPPSRKSRSQSPPQTHKSKSNFPIYKDLLASPGDRGLPTAEELEARLDALERSQCFDFKMQKNYQKFNQKLKDVVSPSLSFDDFNSHKSTSEAETKYKSRPTTPKSIVHTIAETVAPKTIRFRDEVHSQSMHRSVDDSMVSTNNNNVIQILEENSKMIQRILKKTIADTHSSILGRHQSSAVQEGLGVMGIRLMRETSPLQRKGTHTGVPLRTGENINDQLTSIKNTIKSINSLCEEKPYKKERCQQYIDALFSDSTYFATKKSSLEDLATRTSSRSTSREIGPSIRISEHSPAFTRSMGSADSIRSSSPSRQMSSLQYRSNRDLRREPSPRRRRDEDREENESRVRRDNLLPNNINCNHSTLSHSSHSLTKFHKVDSQLISNDIDVDDLELELELEARLRHATDSSIESMVTHDNNTNTSNTVNTTTSKSTLTNEVTTSDPLKSPMLDWPVSPYRQTSNHKNSKTPVYSPAKLEIRHTTVTSTFYDRVLTEKQLEKQQHSVSANRSPMVSPLYERPVRPCSQTNNKSPPKLPYQESTNTMFLSEASAGNYRMYQPNIHANNG